MENRKVWLGMLVLTLVFGFFLTGCDIDINSFSGHTFEFKVSNTTSGIYVRPITKIEFINGSNESATVLQTETISISSGEMTSVYKVSGFTEKEGDDAYIYGIRLTMSTGGDPWTEFKYSSAVNKSKILVKYGVWGISFEEGKW